MQKGCKSDNENKYFKARKEASVYRPELYSRERTSEILGVSASSLADYELGNIKVVPVDKVVLMADLYNCPELKNQYCKHDCPIGKDRCIATELHGLEGATLRLIKQFDDENVEDIKDTLIAIAEDGKISQDEMGQLREVMSQLDRIASVISELRLIGEKALNGKGK